MSTASAKEPKLLPPILTTLQDLRHLPGYAGFRPQYKWRYGDTFGNDTAKYFQQRRFLTLTSSTAKDSGMGWDTKVQLPSVYSNVPNLVLAARSRDRNRMLNPIKYILLNHHNRDEDIRDFLTKVQDHRCQYVDKSGTLPRVDYFVLPAKKEIKSSSATRCGDGDRSSDQNQVSMFCSLCGKKATHQPADFKAFIRGHHQPPNILCTPKSIWTDRQRRDLYFERR